MLSKSALFISTLALFSLFVRAESPLPSMPEIDRALSDPTRPLGYSQSHKRRETLALQAVFTGGNRKKAIINGVALSEGDYIAGKKVLAIRENEVVIDAAGKTDVLKLRPKLFD